ncbi:tRNA 2-thiouridine synthesizing protein C [Pseudomonas pohangensis]|uniref:tRNA 2-thiouridine synthesizing protein C n=1 Tax=Pseudomonas pohangensis TaxID=364197 RepID=A0A1H2EXW5_9PSED|nr:sulfurtransferase complex subunit TusC [Pseudomonas pohangensis]SDT99899.1 tRNA 2-thiouridine synthesizing protein C [Pseudomonas pohangensis]
MPKSLLVVSRQAPWSGPDAREALDLVLAGGAFDLPLGLLFLDDGVFQLQNNQQASAIEQKNLCANLQALPLFGVEALFVSARSLQQRGLEDHSLSMPAHILDDLQIRVLFERYDQVITL